MGRGTKKVVNHC